MKTLLRGLGLVLFILCAGEVAARSYLSGPLDCLEPSEDRDLLYELKPGFYDSDGWFLRMPRVSIVVDGDGCRHMPDHFEATGDTPLTALFMGDSMTFGLGVEDDDAFPAIVEHQIRSHSSKNALIKNCGVPGYNLTQIIRASELRLAQLKPKFLVLALHPADLETAVDFSSLRPKSDAARFAVAHSRLLRLAFVLTRIFIIQRERQTSPEQLSPGQINEQLGRLEQAARLIGSRIIVLEIGAIGHPSLSFDDILTAHAIPFFLLPQFPRDAAHFLTDHEHWNSTGQRIIAQRVTSILEGVLEGAEMPTTN